jgi:hypothetical protein
MKLQMHILDSMLFSQKTPKSGLAVAVLIKWSPARLQW